MLRPLHTRTQWKTHSSTLRAYEYGNPDRPLTPSHRYASYTKRHTHTLLILSTPSTSSSSSSMSLRPISAVFCFSPTYYRNTLTPSLSVGRSCHFLKSRRDVDPFACNMLCHLRRCDILFFTFYCLFKATIKFCKCINISNIAISDYMNFVNAP